MRPVIPAIALLLVLAATAQATTNEAFEARVVGVSDGDTISVQDSRAPPRKIRLAGIDAPEKGQSFGDRSKKNLSSLVFGKTVRIEWSKSDKYGRIVGKVLIAPSGSCAVPPCPATLDVNLAQIAAGYAWHYRQYEKEQSKRDREAYGIAERHARDQKLGLWRDPEPVPPWEWRHGPNGGSARKSPGG
jgi:endonuclease YncB( thermonuclease family)